MDVTINQEGNTYTVVLKGRLDTTNADKFYQDITPLLEAESPEITLDCTDMEYTSSQGLRMFLMLQKSVIAHSGKMQMTGMRPAVKEVFDITGFSNIIKIV